ncbi:MAG: hypothetical protein LAT51_02175 [Flavobacteriaceae bacterium]|nr:hypothetical protein [Flavobacteriaceae bacterium]
MKKLISSLLISIFIFTSCSPLQHNSGSSASLNGFETHKGVITYFVNDSVDQFFVKPLKFKSKDFDLEADYTFRTGDESKFVTVNFSLFSDEEIKANQVESIFYSTEVKDIKKMYAESKSKKKIESRFSGKIDKTNFSKIKPDQNWIIKLKNKNKIKLEPSRKAQKVQGIFQEIDATTE